MDKELQIMEISRLMGWTDLKLTITGAGGGTRFPIAHGIPPKRGYLAPCPRYTNCLNACHEMEKAMNANQANLYRKILSGIASNAYIGSDHPQLCYSEHATAAQRAEALLRTLNLWTPTGEENE